MRSFIVGDVLNILKGEILKGSTESVISNIKLDSRQVNEGDTFFALKGENSDGHLYIDKALELGAKVFVISKKEYFYKFDDKDVCVILVNDALISLQDLASYYMSLMPLKQVVAVTGSVGKTTTRDMVKKVLSTKYKTEATFKNYNTPTFIPLSILEFPIDTEACVIEMGLLFDDQTEEALARFVKPNMAIITNIGISHIERFPHDGRMGILRSKMGVTHYFDKNCVLALNCDNDILSKVEKSNIYKQISVGSESGFDYVISDVNEDGFNGISYYIYNKKNKVKVFLPVLGAHNAINSALAISIGEKAGIPMEASIEALSTFELPDNRLDILKNEKITVIDDCYNAAPESVKSAINTLMSVTDYRRKIVILGDMLELGCENEKSHREIGKYLRELNVDMAIFIGKSMKFAYEEYGKGMYFETVDFAIDYFNKNDIFVEDDIVLVKASHGMFLNKIIEVII